MKIDAPLPKELAAVKGAASQIESDGYDGAWVGETSHDPFLVCLHGADATSQITIGTQVAIAFARTPMITASSAYDLAGASGGRFVLGIGSQVKAHIERRFSMPWSQPAERMREYVLALRAIWSSWQDGTKLAFEGQFYRHTLMTPFFSPTAHEWGPPPVYLAGVGARMTEVAGEVCDGFFFHPFTTASYLREVTLPALTRGRERATRPKTFAVAGPVFTCAGRNERELATAIAGTKAQIAFYASTPTYRPVLDHHGWGDVQPELTRLTKEGRWNELGSLITDEMLHTFAAVGSPNEVGRELRARFGDVATRVQLYTTYEADPAMWPEVVDALRARP